MRRKIIAISTLVLLVLGWMFTKEYQIGANGWKWCNGDRVLGDWEQFDARYFKFNRGKVYQGNVPVAVLVNDHNWLFKNRLVIQSLDGKLQGEYCGK